MQYTSPVWTCTSDATTFSALRKLLYSYSATHHSSRVWLVFILLIICNDLPVLVGVQSVEEIVTAVLPWCVRELEDRQEWKIKAVFTQQVTTRQKTSNAYNHFVLQFLTAIMLLTTLAIWLKIPVVHVKFDTKNNLKENPKHQTQGQETLYLPETRLFTWCYDFSTDANKRWVIPYEGYLSPSRIKEHIIMIFLLKPIKMW